MNESKVDNVICGTQKWYGEYSLSARTYAVPKGYNVEKEGYELKKKDGHDVSFNLLYGDSVFYYTLYQGEHMVNAQEDYDSSGTH